MKIKQDEVDTKYVTTFRFMDSQKKAKIRLKSIKNVKPYRNIPFVAED